MPTKGRQRPDSNAAGWADRRDYSPAMRLIGRGDLPLKRMASYKLTGRLVDRFARSAWGQSKWFIVKLLNRSWFTCFLDSGNF
jgi:hypothetical protein